MIEIDKGYQAWACNTECSLLDEIESCMSIKPPSYDDFGIELKAYDESLGENKDE